MAFEIEDWRALAVGWCGGMVAALLLGVSWWVPVVAIGITIATRFIWR